MPPLCSKEHLGPAVAEIGEDDGNQLVGVASGWSVKVKHEPLGLDDLAILAPPVDLATLRPGEHRRPPRAAGPDVHRDSRERDLESGPPNQSAKRSGSIHSRQTRSRGASKTRVIGDPGSAMAVPLGRLQALVEAVEAAVPEPTVRLEPFDRLLQRRALAAAKAEAAPNGRA